MSPFARFDGLTAGCSTGSPQAAEGRSVHRRATERNRIERWRDRNVESIKPILFFTAKYAKSGQMGGTEAGNRADCRTSHS